MSAPAYYAWAMDCFSVILTWSVSCDPSLSFLGTVGCSLPPPLLHPLFSTGFHVVQVGLELAT